MTITSFDLDNDGVPELITGWSNGKVLYFFYTSSYFLVDDKCGSMIGALNYNEILNDLFWSQSSIVLCAIKYKE